MPVTTTTATLIEEANKCVLCGMCLPHCPTYLLAENENESPRGRLMSGKAFLMGEVEATTQLGTHIDNCLVCRSCEKSCPSGVRFGAFMDGLRKHIPASAPTVDTISTMLIDKDKRRALNQKLWLAQRSGALQVGKIFLNKSDRQIVNSLPRVERFEKLKPAYPASGTQYEKVMLFTGCHSELLGNSLVMKSIELLTLLGVSVDVPEQQSCCGGLSRHHGDAGTANTLEVNNITAFASNSEVPVLTLASGCGASLKDYVSLENRDDQTVHFASRIEDISHFIYRYLRQANVTFKPIEKTICLHTPCSMKNVMRQDGDVQQLLARIPSLQIHTLSSQHGCCGAAGTYMYEHADIASALREPIVDELESLRPDLLVTTNIGCAMHIQTGLGEAGMKMNVMHPVELLLESIVRTEA